MVVRAVFARLSLTLAVAMSACSPASRRTEVPPAPNPLPQVVKGANLRPVGDARRGYGTRTARQTMERLRELGVNTIGILMEGRLSAAGDTDVMGPGRSDLSRIRSALEDARALGFATLLVPHLYVDDGTWRGRLYLDTPKARDRWWQTYGAFIETSAAVAEATGTTVLSLGVELKAMSDRPEALSRMGTLAQKVRAIYRGKLTYSANWDEAEDVVFWSVVDWVGVNGYYPLEPTPARGAEAVARRLRALSERTDKEVLVLEVGYRSSPLSHIKPWEWPEQITPQVDEEAQARAWAAVLTHWLGAPGVRGLLAWVIPTDPDDPASEPRHGFNPLNKQAELVLKEGFTGAPSLAGH